MGFDAEQLCAIRPFVYHLTAQSNLECLLAERVLYPASHLLTVGGRKELVTQRRNECITLSINGRPIHIRDQQPLRKGMMSLANGMSFSDFVKYLNEHVFFWPGKAAGPNQYGERHFERYKNDNPAIIRCSLAELISLNGPCEPLVCKYNSGVPRYSYGVASPRGASTFQPCNEADFPP